MSSNISHLQQRVVSLDFFRGLTVIGMILANNPGRWEYLYAPLRHAEWHGCTPTDLIFPFFLFIVGVSISFAIGNKKALITVHRQLILKAFRRMLFLFCLGIFLSLYPKIFSSPIEALKSVRIPGVLQRTAVVYFISTIIFLKFSPSSIFKIMLILLITYWVLMTFVSVPGIGCANLEKETNLGAWVDRSLLTEAHLWRATRTWDPEGILGTIPSVSTALLGILAGIILRIKGLSDAKKTAWLFFGGVLAAITGLIWDLKFPINKSLWTSSFVLYTGGLASAVLALCYWTIDVKGYNKLTKPVVVYGTNAIVVFFISGLLPRTLNLIPIASADGNKTSLLTYLYKTLFTPYLSPYNASLAWAIMWLLFWMSILWVMHNRKIFIKV
jgi:predicted acyltransferase